MTWQVILAIVLVVPIILLPVLFVWYLNAGGIVAAIKEAKAKRVAQKKSAKVTVKAE